MSHATQTTRNGRHPTTLRFRLLLGALCAVACAGCGSRTTPTPDSIKTHPNASGDGQCATYGATLSKPLQVVVEGHASKGILRGASEGRPVSDATVTFRVLNPECGALFEETESPITTATTDVSGVAQARLRVGRRAGEIRVSASIATADGPESVGFSALAGVERIGGDLEAPTGGNIDEFGVRLVDPNGQPAAGVPVLFRVEGDSHGAALGNDLSTLSINTDANGRAVTTWRLGTKTGRYFTRVEIRDDRPGVPEHCRFRVRAIDFEAMALNPIKMLMGLVGGLAIFILGMRGMSGGLRQMADRRLKAILEAMTRNRLIATGVGAGFTALIQSSSATTVMTVGFVNAGLLSLSQAIAVDYGACIGTTVTAQIIAFKLNTLAFPAIALGLLLSVMSRSTRLKSLGEAVLGFGLLFLGLTLMSDILKPLRHSPGFVAWFQMFDCTPKSPGGFIQPWPAAMCILVGTIATMIIQSSSATVGLVLVLASQGLLNFETAFPLVLGGNIGTTITAVLASLGANRNAKRTALAHTLFKTFGAVYMYVLLFVPLWDGKPIFLGFVDYVTPGNVFAAVPENLPRHIANAHTAFNVISVVVFLPLIGSMVRLCQRIIPLTASDEEQVLAYLEPNLLQSPALALQQAVQEVAYMVRRAQKSISEACTFFEDGSRELEDRIMRREELIDRLQHEITAYLVELSRQPLSPQESELIPALVHAVNDAERIGDHSEDLVELAHLRREGKLELSQKAQRDIRRLKEILDQQFEATYRSLVDQDEKHVERVLEVEREINTFMRTASDSHMNRLEEGRCEVAAGILFLDVLTHLERIGDHLKNIAERAGRVIRVTS